MTLRKAPTLLQANKKVSDETETKIGTEYWKVYDTEDFGEKDLKTFFTAMEVDQNIEHYMAPKVELGLYRKNSLLARQGDRSPPAE